MCDKHLQDIAPKAWNIRSNKKKFKDIGLLPAQYPQATLQNLQNILVFMHTMTIYLRGYAAARQLLLSFLNANLLEVNESGLTDVQHKPFSVLAHRIAADGWLKKSKTWT